MVAASFQTQSQSESHVALFSPQELRQQPLPPSERDFQVFESVAIDGASTRQAAAEFGVSQSRIVQIRRHVAEWMGAEVPPTPRLTPIQRLRVAAEIAERRADHLYSQAMEGWRASQQPQTSICRGSLGSQTQTTRERHGDPRYLWAAMRITERQIHLAGTIRKVLSDDDGREGVAREGEAVEAPAEPRVQGSGFGVQEGQQESNPPVRACSHNEAASGYGHAETAEAVDATNFQDDVCDELASRRREFLAALRDVAAPVQPPFTDAHGMPMDEPTEREDASFLPLAAGAERQLGSTALSSRPLNRKERRARQRMMERRLRKAK